MMIWHIFKKDWTLMWPYALGLAALHFAGMVGLLGIGRFHAAPFIWMNLGVLGDIGADNSYYAFTNLFIALSYLTSAFLITAIVQQDPIPGVRQDWLVRPIRRRDMFLAKLVGVLIMVLAPIFLADLSGALLNGFPLGPSLDAALARSVGLWFSLFLAVFALASLTKNLMEAFVGGTVIVGAYLILPVVLRFWRPEQIYFLHGRVDWIDRLIHLGIILMGAALLLGLQYFLRKTFVSRLVTAGSILLLLLVPPVPWQTAFAIEERLSPNPAAGNAVAISFVPDPQVRRDGPVGPLPYDRSDASVMLPIRVIGMPAGAILYGESSRARVVSQDGSKEMGSGQLGKRGFQMGLPTRYGENVEPGKPFNYVVGVPRDLYSRIADQSVRLEIDYQLTLLKLADSQTLPAIGGNQRTTGLGWCGTKMREDGGEIKLGCISTVQPSCISMVLEYKPTGVRNPPNGFCGRPDYSPLRLGFGADALNRFTEMLPFGNPGGVDQFPVTEPMLPQSQIKVQMYQAEDHFERRLTIPQIRLRDWVAAE